MRAALRTVLVLICAVLLIDAAPIKERKLKLKLPTLGGGKKTPPPVKALPPPPVKITSSPPPPPVKVISLPPPPIKVVSPPPPVKVVPTPTPPPAKPTRPPPPAKPTPVQVSAPAKTISTSTISIPSTKACSIRRPASGKKVIGRADTAADECDETPAAICAKAKSCEECITTFTGESATARCGFTFQGGLCKPISSRETLATLDTQCKTIGKQQAVQAANSDDAVIAKAAADLYDKKIKAHVLGTDPKIRKKLRKGRHLLKVWVKSNPTSTKTDFNDDTGIVVFSSPNVKNKKTVWNDRDTEGQKVVYNEDDVKALCVSALIHSIKANQGTKTAINGSKIAAKGKGNAVAEVQKTVNLKPKPGVRNGFVTFNRVANRNMCIVVHDESCFPTSLDLVPGEVGSSCQGDVEGVFEEED